jgi:hypothetical protein
MLIDVCPLCNSNLTESFYRDSYREYLKCSDCDFVFVPIIYHLSEKDERARYDSHNNNPEDDRYRNFLSQLLDPLQEKIPKNASGLDFGSGPGPTLSLMLEERGYSVDLYDKFYARNDVVFEKQYDFITASEVVEHLNQPIVELNRLMSLLKSNGVLAIMTQILTPQIDFNKWYYKNDPSHIGFFSEKALRYLGEKWQAKLYVVSERVVMFKKNKTLFG